MVPDTTGHLFGYLMATVLLSGNGPNKCDKEDFWVSGGVWNHKVGLDFLFFMILGAIPEEVYSVCDVFGQTGFQILQIPIRLNI